MFIGLGNRQSTAEDTAIENLYYTVITRNYTVAKCS